MSLWDLKLAIRLLRCLTSSIWTLSLWDLKPIWSDVGLWTNKFELCPYGIWNTFSISSSVEPESIWTLSLWDLKRNKFKNKESELKYLNFVPMGFETLLETEQFICIHHLNFVPMGFETIYCWVIPLWSWIWTLSLWDLKQK